MQKIITYYRLKDLIYIILPFLNKLILKRKKFRVLFK